MSIIDFIQGPAVMLGDVGKLCFEACSEAYGTTNSTPCAFGCQSQLPSTEVRRNQVAKMNLDDDEGWMSFGEYSSRMMNCLLDRMSHQVSYGWIMISSSSSFTDGDRVIVVQGAPVFIGIGVPAELNPETKTSHYVETNLAVVDSGATQNVKHSQIMSMDFFSSHVSKEGVAKITDRRAYATYDWLSCLSAKTGLSKVSILFLFFSLLLVLVWFVVGVCFPTRQRDNTSEYQKMSIYGDMEYLTPVDSKSMLYSPNQKFAAYSTAPLIKMPLQEI